MIDATYEFSVEFQRSRCASVLCIDSVGGVPVILQVGEASLVQRIGKGLAKASPTWQVLKPGKKPEGRCKLELPELV